MQNRGTWLVTIVIFAACTCGARTECGSGRIQIGFLTAIHDDPDCNEISPKGVLMYEAANFIANAHNEKSKGFDIEIIVQDTCDSITGSLKAAMKAMVMADVNCLQPPNFLGIIGPDTVTNVDAVNKMTAVLKVPLVVKKSNGNAPYIHYLAKESDTYIVKGVIKLLEALKWKTFTLVTNSDENNDNDVQNIAKKLTMEAIGKSMCVMIQDDDDSSEYSSRIVHVGNPKIGFFNEPSNATILVVSEGNLEGHLNLIETSNNIILLEDSRNDFAGLEARVEKSKLWAGNEEEGKYDAEELREVRWLEDAVNSYSKALEIVCKKKKCKGQMNPSDWNNVLTSVIADQNTDVRASSKTLDLALKMKGTSVQELGKIMVLKSTAKMFWKGESLPRNEDDFEDEMEDDFVVPEKFKRLISKDRSSGTGCATSKTGFRVVDDDGINGEVKPIIVSEVDDSEWWTMIATVSGVGVAMFVVGILAVYILVSNIRGPRLKSTKGRFSGSFRRNGSDREIPTAMRTPRPPQRTDSIRSAALSENGV